MPRQRDGFVPLGDVAGAVELPGESPARPRHFTRLDQVTQLVGARDADPDVGFQARMIALCSLPGAPTPATRLQYIRRNGPYTLAMLAGANNKLPYGSSARLLMAWVSTEAGAHAIARVGVGTLVDRVHERPRHQQRKRRPPRRSHPAPQPDGPVVQLGRSVHL